MKKINLQNIKIGGQFFNLAYEGASRSNRTENWDAPIDGPNSALENDLDLLIRRSRAAYRNIPWIRHAIDSLAYNEIGAGITPRFISKNKKIRDKLQEIFKIWKDEIDQNGVLNFFGLQHLAVLERLIAGECFIKIIHKRKSDNLYIPLQLQLIESEQLPLNYSNDDNRYCGIEINSDGERIAYHFYKNHPGEYKYNLSSNDLIIIPADQVIHFYQPLRAGQLRGEPVCSASLLRTKVFDSYEDAELIRKKTRSHITGFIRKPINNNDFIPLSGEPTGITGGTGEINIKPGTFPELQAGEDVTFLNSDDSGQGYDEFQREQKMGMAAGLGIPYEVLSGDYSKVNDRIMRAILNDFHRQIIQKQDHITIHQFCRRVGREFVDAAVLSGAIEIKDYASNIEVRRDTQSIDWCSDEWPYIHPLQDIQAKSLLVKNGFRSRANIVSAMDGVDIEDLDNQNANDTKRENSLGLQYETNIGAKSGKQANK